MFVLIVWVCFQFFSVFIYYSLFSAVLAQGLEIPLPLSHAAPHLTGSYSEVSTPQHIFTHNYTE